VILQPRLRKRTPDSPEAISHETAPTRLISSSLRGMFPPRADGPDDLAFNGFSGRVRRLPEDAANPERSPTEGFRIRPAQVTPFHVFSLLVTSAKLPHHIPQIAMKHESNPTTALGAAAEAVGPARSRPRRAVGGGWCFRNAHGLPNQASLREDAPLTLCGAQEGRAA
jgi:hypothetical protein